MINIKTWGAFGASLLITMGGAFGQTRLEAPVQAEVNSTVLVKYFNAGTTTGQITLADPRGARLEGANPADLSGEENGSVEILMPSVAANYTILFVDGATTLATRPIAVVGEGTIAQTTEVTEVTEVVEVVPADDVVTATLEAPKEVPTGYAFQVNWAGPGNVNDRIAIVDPAVDDALLTYAFINPANPRVIMQTGATSGEKELQYINGEGTVLVRQPIMVTPAAGERVKLKITSEANTTFSPERSLAVILDASGSMLQDQGDEDRIDIAKDTLLAFLKNSVPKGTPFTLRAFGHIEADSCETELLVPLSPFDYEGVAPIIREVEAINLAKTPLADSLRLVKQDLGTTPGPRTVVLLTDGEETCEGDPAAVIQEMRADGTDVRVNIVGYAIADKDLRENFESWAALGEGRYFDATEGESLDLALRGAVAIPYGLYANNQLIATGRSGQTEHLLPAGDYDLVYNYGGNEVRKPITVLDQPLTEIALP